MGFWEPTRLVDVTRVPFCMVGLGGESFDTGYDTQRGSQYVHDNMSMHSNYQAHWYLNPVLYYLNEEINNECYESGGFDVVYITEVDSLWGDDEASAVLHPEATLFANPIAQAACAADCISASTGFGIREMFWCGGCQGSVYPFTGHVGTHIGGIQASELIVHRLAAKMHRMFIAWTYAGEWALCGPYPQPLMDKRQYKTDLVYPIPRTSKNSSVGGSSSSSTASSSLDGQCCSPFGRSTILWSSMKEYPVMGEDFAYQLFRKRNCCAFELL